jgi:hypothetical protein
MRVVLFFVAQTLSVSLSASGSFTIFFAQFEKMPFDKNKPIYLHVKFLNTKHLIVIITTLKFDLLTWFVYILFIKTMKHESLLGYIH